MEELDELCDVQVFKDHVPRQMLLAGLTVEGFSRAAVQTYWRIPELKIGFDVGAQPWAFMGLPRIFLSHTHMDHILSLPAYVARRRMMRMESPIIYLPSEAVGNVRNLLSAYSRLDYGALPCELIGVSAGDELVISRELVISVVPTFHSIPSVGYIVWERRKKLKEEYLLLSGGEIRDLALSGVEVSREIRTPKIAYLGDSTIRALDETPSMYEAEILIMEMSFVARRHQSDKIRKYGHIHLDDIVKRQSKFKNKAVVLSHFSARYADKEIESTVIRRIPTMLDGRLILWF
ncbi:MAG: metal-dependent hydrolase [Planctomycetaceae bacterium]|jgi:ribonuclease Z|nr:metal-dependent hydrolase [Planctomycetaceae bacterium]